jgi:hypothetical protein
VDGTTGKGLDPQEIQLDTTPERGKRTVRLEEKVNRQLIEDLARDLRHRRSLLLKNAAESQGDMKGSQKIRWCGKEPL